MEEKVDVVEVVDLPEDVAGTAAKVEAKVAAEVMALEVVVK